MKKEPQNDWSGKSRGGASGYLIFVFIIRRAGLGAAYALLSLVALYFIPFAPRATASAWQFSRHILKKGKFASALFVYRNFLNLGISLIDKTAVSAGEDKKFTFEFDEPENVSEILAGNSGAVIIGAHFGNWEVGAPYFGKYGKKMRVVMMDAEYQSIKKVLQAQNRLDAFSPIPITDDSFSHIFEIRDSLGRGEYVAMQGDRLTPNGKSREIIFMGKPALFPLGPFVLAARFGYPVIFYFAVRTGLRKYRFHFSLYEPLKRDSGVKPETDILNAYTAYLETVVAKSPEQWYNFYKFWL